MTWQAVLSFARGPFFYASLLIFIAGMIFRLVSVVGLGWSKDREPPMGSKTKGVI